MDALCEGLNKSGLVQKVVISADGWLDCWRGTYYGLNVSRAGEPVDQLDAILVMSRLQRETSANGLLIYCAGRYGELNGGLASELIQKDWTKLRWLMRCLPQFGVSPTVRSPNFMAPRFITPMTFGPATATVFWKSPVYWNEVLTFKDREGIIDSARLGRGKTFREVAAGFESEVLAAIPAELLESIGDISASALYRLFEVAEAASFKNTICPEKEYRNEYLPIRSGGFAKIGPVAEEEYDRFIGEFMDIVELRQPLDFRSSPDNAKPLVPYIGKEGEERIFLEDSKEELVRKVGKLSQRASRQPIIYPGNEGFMNPFVRTAILAVEAAAAKGSIPVSFLNRRVSDGRALLEYFERAGTDKLERYASAVVECLWAYVLLPMQKVMQDIKTATETMVAETIVTETKLINRDENP
jgi:hypothetical protein